MKWYDNYDFSNWALVKYPDAQRVPRSPERIAEYRSDVKAKRWPARSQETIEALRQTCK